MDIKEICLDEIALEGLDGITLPALWLRLENRNLPIKLNNCVKEYLWNFIVQHESLECYQILEDRSEPTIFNRFENLGSSSIPAATAPDELETLVDVYSTAAVMDAEVRGSCSDYNERINISHIIAIARSGLDATLGQFGARKLVIAASQALRNKAMLHKNNNPTVLSGLTDVAYCVLERICRSRYQGELQSALNKLNFKEKGISHIHYVINSLSKLGLVIKNNRTYKRADMGNRTFFQVLIHSPRFERDCRDFNMRMLDKIREIVNGFPDKSIILSELRDRLQVEPRPFKTLYKNLVKSGEGIVESVNPTAKKRTITELKLTLLNKPCEAITEDDDEEDILKIFASDSKSSIRPLVLEQPFIYQGYMYVLDNGEEGVTQRKILEFLKGYGRLEARNLCKTFNRMDLVSGVLVDQGKQRVQTFYPKHQALVNYKNLEFSNEKEKMQRLLDETVMSSDKHTPAIHSSVEESMNCTMDISDANMNTSTNVFQQETGDTKECLQQTKTTIMTLPNEGSNEVIQSNSSSVLESPSRVNIFDSLIQNRLLTPSHQHRRKWHAHLTARKLKRHNNVLELLNDEKIIEGFRDLQKALAKFEEEEGCTTKIDKKTVMRLVERMNQDGIIQHSVIPITHNCRTENFHFIMALDCPVNLLKSAVDQARFKLLGDEENRFAREKQQQNKEVVKAKGRNTKDKDFGYGMDTMSVLNMGNVMTRQFFQPKFKRVRVVHEILWYLLYGHPDIIDWSPEMGIQDPDAFRTYCKEISWKRFLPPVPVHTHDGVKWLQLGDVATILPLSIFCQFHRINYEVQNIDEWLADEEKRHTLVRHLPQDIRSLLFYKRKYMFSLMLCIEQLTFMGLITMRRGRSGTNVNMPKENMLIYVHKNVSILDTRSSGQQHVKVENKDYEKINIVLNEFVNVEEFWFQLQDICVQTNLGFTQFQESDYDDIKDHLGTAELKKYITFITQHQPKPADDSTIPGDNRGAGGLDSSMYSYLYRNWRSKPHMEAMERKAGISHLRLPKLREKSYSLTPKRKKVVESQDETDISFTLDQNSDSSMLTDSSNIAESTKAKTKKSHKATKSAGKNKNTSEPQLVTVNNVGRNERVKGGRGRKRKKQSVELEIPMKKLRMQVRRRGRKKPETVKKGRQKYKYVDGKDLEAIKERKGRLRVNFTPAEDSMLLICHIATTVLTHLFWKKQHGPRKCLTPWSVIRDISQRHLPESLDKTSYSVGRRTLNIMRNPETRICHDISVADIESDRKFIKQFKIPSGDLDTQETAAALREVYSQIVQLLQVRFKSQPGIFSLQIPNSVSELLKRYIPKTILRKSEDIQIKRNLFLDHVRGNADITHAVIENMTYVALQMGEEEFSVYQAYRAFESFPEDILSKVFTLMQTSGFVCAKQEMLRRLPFGIRSHRLAQAYIQTFKAVVPQEALEDLSHSIVQTSDMKIDSAANVGHIFLISYLLSKGDLQMKIDMPDQIIIPDAPNMPVFENQFLAIIKESKDEIFNEASSMLSSNSKDDSAPPESLIAAAACMLPPTTTSSSVADSNSILEDNSKTLRDNNDPSNSKTKLEKVLRLYYRHPSYTNWLMLINPSRRGEVSDAKFTNLNYSCNSDSVVLNPCTVTVEDSQNLLSNYAKVARLKGTNGEKDLDLLAQRITRGMESVKLQHTESNSNWIMLQKSVGGQRAIFKLIFQIINNTEQLGITGPEILALADLHDNTAIEEALNIMKANNVVFIVGVKEARYVTYNHVQIWTAKGFRFCDRSTKFHDEISHEIELLHQNEKVPMKTNEDEQRNINLTQSVNTEIKKKYQEVKFLCRPWHTIGGDVSFNNAKAILFSVYLKIFASPGITQQHLCASYSFQPICILQLLEILCKTGCITKHIIETPGPKKLFGALSKPNITTYYEATQDGLIILSKWCNSINSNLHK
ncbi:general transcription factor 3C polypeptide 1-like [Styela clava]